MWSLDFWLAVGLLAIVPFWMAAYGGHVAADTITDPKKSRTVKIRFWLIAIVGLAVACAYQYRTSKSDENKQSANERWQKSVTIQLDAIGKNPSYSPDDKLSAKQLRHRVEEGVEKNPLEIVAFNSSQDISLANNGPRSIYVIRLLVNEGSSSKSFGLDSEIEPGKTKKVLIGDGFHNVRTLRGLAVSWNEHLKKAQVDYANCWQFTFFSQSDARLLQIRDHYVGEGESFIYDRNIGTIYYKLDGSQGIKEQKVPIAVTVTVNADVCPGS